VSNYEVLNSGIIHALKQYLTEGEPVTRLRRICLFTKLFDRPVNLQSEDSTDKEDDVDDEDGEGSIRIRRKSSTVMLSGSPFRNSLGSSPTTSLLLNMKRGKPETNPTYLFELVRRLGSCFSSLENFPLVVNEHITMLTGIGNVVSTMGRAFKIKLQRLTKKVKKEWERQEQEKLEEQKTPKKKKQPRKSEKKKKTEEEIIQVDVTVTPLSRMYAVERYVALFEERKKKQEEQGEQAMEESDETNYFEVDENADNEEETQVNNTTVIAIDRPEEGIKRYDFLQTPRENDHDSKYPKKYELLINGHVIDHTSSVMGALYRYESLKAKHPSTIRLNDGEHIIYYREIPESDTEMNESNQVSVHKISTLTLYRIM
jgi:Sec-independent protein translocase protein TatA